MIYNELPLPFGGKGREQHWRKQLNKYLDIDQLKDKHIIDVGCGTGTVTKILAEYSNNVRGCDISDNSLDIARTKVENILFQNKDILSLDYEDKQFDLAVCIGVIHHTGDPQKAFTELIRITKGNGQILLFVYNKDGFYYWVYNSTRFIFKNKKIEDIPKPFIQFIGWLVGLFYHENVPYQDAKHWVADIFLSDVVDGISLSTLETWAKDNKCLIMKTGYTFFNSNIIISMTRVG